MSTTSNLMAQDTVSITRHTLILLQASANKGVSTTANLSEDGRPGGADQLPDLVKSFEIVRGWIRTALRRRLKTAKLLGLEDDYVQDSITEILKLAYTEGKDGFTPVSSEHFREEIERKLCGRSTDESPGGRGWFRKRLWRRLDNILRSATRADGRQAQRYRTSGQIPIGLISRAPDPQDQLDYEELVAILGHKFGAALLELLDESGEDHKIKEMAASIEFSISKFRKALREAREITRAFQDGV